MTPHRPVAGVIVYVLKPFHGERKVLFLKRSGGLHTDSWWPVAGKPEPGEVPLDTALRELEEETSLTPVRVFSFGIEIPHADQGKALATYVALVDGDAAVTLNYEHSDYNWITGAEAIAQVPDHSKQYLEHLDRHFIEQCPDTAWEINIKSHND